MKRYIRNSSSRLRLARERLDVHASMDLEELEDAILNEKPFELDDFAEYWSAFHEPEKGALRADEVRVGDVLKNTEDASEFDIGDIFRVNSITPGSDTWSDFDYEFDITILKGAEKYIDADPNCKIHYMKDEYVGVPASITASCAITSSKAISQDLRSILEDVMIDTLDSYSGSHVLNEFVENARYLQSWDEYDEAHPDEMTELRKLSNNRLVDIGNEILDEINANWRGEDM